LRSASRWFRDPGPARQFASASAGPHSVSFDIEMPIDRNRSRDTSAREVGPRTCGRVTRIQRPALLASDIVEAILAERRIMV
jgi:hypothetical protein